jgi:histidinol-phosphate aminotransferase
LKPCILPRDEFEDFDTQPNMIFLDANENPFENGVNGIQILTNECKEVLAKQRNVKTNQILLRKRKR